ncbi:hypothetical protein SALBM311S_05770 [Streptomyces alboniger]
MQPVADIAALPVQRDVPPVEEVGHEQRDDLLGELVRPVVVGAPGDAHVQTVGAVVRQRIRSLEAFAAEYGELGPTDAPRARSPARWSRRPRRWRCARRSAHPAAGPRPGGSGCPPRSCGRSRPRRSIERSTCDSAAKCTTSSASAVSLPTSSASRMSPCTNAIRGCARLSRLPRVPAYVSLSSTVIARPGLLGREQRTHVVRADEPGTAGHQDPGRVGGRDRSGRHEESAPCCDHRGTSRWALGYGARASPRRHAR